MTNSYVEAPDPSVTVFSHKDFWEVIKIQLGHKVGVDLSSGGQAFHGGQTLHTDLVWIPQEA